MSLISSQVTRVRTQLRRPTAVLVALMLLFAFGSGALDPDLAGASPATGSISGTITNPDNSPAAGVNVDIIDNDGNNDYTTTTASDGTYSFTGVAATTSDDPYHFNDIFSTDPSVGVYDFYNNPIAPIVLTAGQSVTGVNTKFVAPGSISGTVTFNGTPVSGVQVTASGRLPWLNGASPAAQATTGSDGTYTLVNLSPSSTGNYSVQFSDDSGTATPSQTNGYLDQYWDGQTDQTAAQLVAVTSTGTTSGIDAQLVEGSSISGKVVDSSGNPISGATVSPTPIAFPPKGQFTSTATDGTFTVRGLGAGPYTLYVDPPDSSTEATNAMNPIIVPTAGSVSGITIMLPPVDSTTTGSAHGTVTDASGNPIAGATVEYSSSDGMRNPDGSLIDYTATTDAQGNYALTGIAADSYDVMISDSPVYAPYRLWADLTANGAPGDGSIYIAESQAAQVDAHLAKNAVFSGTIKDANNNPIPANTLQVAFENTSNSSIVYIAPISGSTWQAYLPAGTYKIEFTSAGLSNTYVAQWWNNAATDATATPITVTSGQSATAIDAVVQPQVSATVPGAPTGVHAAAGNAMATVTWSAPASDGGSAVTGYQVTSSPGGKTCTTTGALSCEVSGLSNGTAYSFTVTATNSVGTSAVSTASNSVTPQAPATVPGAPTGVHAAAGNAMATVTWSAPASDGGSAVTGYQVTSSPGGKTCTTTGALTCGVSGLSNGTAYSFTVTATNSVGTGAVSTASNSVTPQIPPNTANESFVIAAYTDFLGRAPLASELTSWTQKLGAGTSRTTMLKTLANSHEWVAHIVTQFYQDTLGRQPDQAGLNYWIGLITAGKLSVARVAAQFYASDEYFQVTGHSNVDTWIGDLYTKLLHRSFDQPGLTYWSSEVAKIGRGGVAYLIYQSVESRKDRVTNLYNELLHRSPDAAGLDYWTTQLETLGDINLAVSLADSVEYYNLAHTRFP